MKKKMEGTYLTWRLELSNSPSLQNDFCMPKYYLMKKKGPTPLFTQWNTKNLQHSGAMPLFSHCCRTGSCITVI